MSVLPKPDHEPTWISWIGAATAVLRAVGLDVDATEVAGQSGYAFQLTINDGVCPSGPTCLSWAALAERTMPLGRSALTFTSGDCLTAETKSDRTVAHARRVFEIVSHEVGEGRPVVVWGIGIPEFSVVYGVEGEEYVVVPWGPVPERCRFDELDAPGGPAVFAWPTPRPRMANADRLAVAAAVRALSRDGVDPHGPGGGDAYARWDDHLVAERAVTHGNSYNAQCWAEARRFARDFTARLAERNDIPGLTGARKALEMSAGALGIVAETFPFDFNPAPVTDATKIATAREALRAARAADATALAAFREALAAWAASAP